MTDTTPQSSCSSSCSPLKGIVMAIVLLAVGFAGGHIASDMNLIKGAPKLPAAKQGAGAGSTTHRTERDARTATDAAENAADDAAAKTEEVLDEAQEALDDATGG